MNRRPAAALALLLALGTLVAACGDDDDAPAPTTSAPATTTPPTSAQDTTTSSAPAAPTTGTTAGTTTPAPVIPTAPADYAAKLIEAWESGDVEAAHVYATDEAVDALFAQEGGGAGTWHLQGCEGAAGSSYCTFGAGGDPTVIVRVLNEPASQASPQAVTEVRFQP